MPTRILLAESDDVLRASLGEQLEREGYEVIAAASGEDARIAAREPLAFAIIGLGETVAATLREQGLNCPVLLLWTAIPRVRSLRSPGRSAFPRCWRNFMASIPIRAQATARW